MEVNFKWIPCFLMLVRFVSAGLISTPTATNTSKRKGHRPRIRQQNDFINDGVGISDEIKTDKIPLKYLYLTDNVRFLDKLSKFYRPPGLSFPLQDVNAKNLMYEIIDSKNLKVEDGHMGHFNVAGRYKTSHDDLYVPLAIYTDSLSGEKNSLLQKYSLHLSKMYVPVVTDDKLLRNVIKRCKRRMNTVDSTGLRKIKEFIKRTEPPKLDRNDLRLASTKGTKTNVNITRIVSEISEGTLFVYATDGKKASQETSERSLKAEQATGSISVNDTSISDKSDTLHRIARKLTELGEETYVGNKLIYSIALPGNSEDQGHVDGKWVTQRRLDNRQLKSLEDDKDAMLEVVVSEAEFQLSRLDGKKTRNSDETDKMVHWKRYVRNETITQSSLTQSLSTRESMDEEARKVILSMETNDNQDIKNETKHRSSDSVLETVTFSSVDKLNTTNNVHQNSYSILLHNPNSADHDQVNKVQTDKNSITTTTTTTIYKSIQSVPWPALPGGVKGRKMKGINHRERRDLEGLLGNSTVGPTVTALDNATSGATVTIDTTVNRQSYTTGNLRDKVTMETFMVTTERADTTTGDESFFQNKPQGDTKSSVVSKNSGSSFNLLISIQSNSSILFIMPSFVLLTLLGLVAAGVRRWQAIKKAQTREQLLPPARGKDGDYSMDNPLHIDIDAPSTSKYLPGTSSENSGSPENSSGGLFTVSGGNGYPLFNTFPHRTRRGTQERTSSFDSSRQCCCSWCLIQNHDVQTTRL